MESHALMNTNPCVRRGTLGNTHAIHSRPHTACTHGGGPAKSEPGACVVMLPRRLLHWSLHLKVSHYFVMWVRVDTH
jgi:hypothetical protein